MLIININTDMHIRIYINKTEINLYILRMNCKLKIKLFSSNNYIKQKTAVNYGFKHAYVRRILLY